MPAVRIHLDAGAGRALRWRCLCALRSGARRCWRVWLRSGAPCVLCAPSSCRPCRP